MGFPQVDIRVCFKTAWTCGDSPDSRGPGPEPTPPPPGVSLSSPQPCGGPAALVKLNRHKGLETADGPGHSPAHRHCPASTLTLARREAQPLLPDLGSQGPSASPENQRAKTTPWEVRPLADTGATRSGHWGVPEPHRGQHGASPQGLIGGGLQPRRAWSGRVAPAEGIGRWRRRQAGRLAQRGTPHFLQDEPWSELWAQLRPREEPRARRNPPAARPLTGCHRGRAGSARRGRWSRRSGR